VPDPAAIERPWRRELTRGAAPAVPLPADEPTERFVSHPGSTLLILGEPGAGKSVEVVLLARSLLSRARAAQRGPGSADPAGPGTPTTAAAMTNAGAPAPVLLYLSSWDEKRLPLRQWIAAEVQRLYGITARLGTDWLARGLLLPLLDGLDEMAEAHRPACADAINAFHRDHPGVSLVVTCRTAEYRELPGALRHGDAIRLLPLEREQFEGYLQGASPALDGLRQAMAQDRWLAAMATSPFWLRAMGLAYRDQTVEQVIATLPAPAGTDQVQGHHAAVCEAYLDEALRRKDYLPKRGYTEAQTRRWLTRLAVEQERRGRTLFRIEDLQPDWGSRWLLGLLGFAVIFAMAIVMGVLSWEIHQLATGTTRSLADTPVLYARVGLFCGIVALPYGTLGTIKPAERVFWSWSSFRREAPLKMPVGAVGMGWFSAGTGWLLFGGEAAMSAAVLGALLGSVAGMLDACLATSMSDTSSKPNQGIRRSLQNGLRLSALGVPVGIAVIWLTALLLPDDRLLGIWLGWQVAPELAVCGFAVGFLTLGGWEAIHHYLLRLALRLQGRLPLNLARFCNHAAGLILLQRAGGGWLPIHGEFQQHLAARAAAPEVST